MTDLLDARSRATLSDDEVFAWPRSVHDDRGLLSGREVATTGSGSVATSSVSPAPPSAASRRTRDLVEPLLWLNDDWDGHGAAAPTVKALEVATRFLGSLPNNIAAPDVVASVTGGVLVEWETATIDLTIEIERTGTATVYVRRGDNEEEGPLSSHQVAAAEALAALVTNSR